jgi:4-amino-4-deoxy-L-arabinose transferase-like glycosyltransferase
MRRLYQSKLFIWSLILLYSLTWLYMLGSRTLVPTDEGRYAEMAREMLVTGDWITPRLNGIKYFEKPPLQTWMNALTFRLFGLGEWQARLWTGLCGLGGIGMVAVAGRKVFSPYAGFVAALVLGSSFYWVALGHINTLDMGLSAMMTLSLCSLLIAQRDNSTRDERRNWMLACWAGMALAVLSKGMIGIVLPGAVLILYALLSKDWGIWKRLHMGKGLLLFLTITAPWFLLVSLKNPEFPYFFFIHEHFERFLLRNHHREGGWYYFLPLLLLGFIPWLGMLFQALLAGLRQNCDSVFQPRQLLTVWTIFIFLFFSISNSKLPSYILPIFPALALLTGCWLETASRRNWIVTAGLVATLGAIGLPLAFRITSLAKNPLEKPFYAAYQPWVITAAIMALVGGLFSLLLLRSRRRDTDLAAVPLAVTGFIIVIVLMQGHEPFGRNASGLPLVSAINAELSPSTPLYALGRYDQVLPFYIGRTMILVENQSELSYGLKQQPELWLPTREMFFDKWAAGPKSVAVASHPFYENMKAKNIPMRVIAQDSRRIVITNETDK